MEEKKSKLDPRQVIYELKEDPLRKFKAAFALMSIIPLLIVLYLILDKFFSFSVFIGNTGIILILSIVISLSGFLFGYAMISRTLVKLMFYAAKARESDQLKSTLVANVSHEVRNPLAIVKMTLANLLDGISGKVSEIQKRTIQSCQQTVERLIRLVNQLLDLSKIEAGRVTMQRSLVNLNMLIDNELVGFAPALKNKNLQLQKPKPGLELKVWADHDKIAQVFSNLFDNAVKYTAENGKISVRLADANSNARIEIEDSGRGIPEDKLEKIFDKFERVAQGKEVGTGLGLPIVKDIIEMHHGQIWVQSRIGKGSKFTFQLPKDLRGKKRK